MRLASKRPARLVALFTALTLVAAACGDDGETASTAPTPSVADGSGDTAAGSAEMSGSVVISGSSTVEPISTAVAEKFSDMNPDVDIAVDGPGTGDGFQLFCAGDTDISDASRPIKAEEAETCESNGVEFIELRIGIDGISVLTSEGNDAIDCLTFADIYALVGPESQGIDNWQGADPIAEELGSETAFPDLPLDIVAPGEESGTYDSFVEIVIEEFNEDRGAEAQTRPDYTASGDDNVIIQGIQGSPGSFGWVGFAFAEEASGVREFAVDNGESGCIEPTAETIASGEYPISRPLFIYVNANKLEESPALEAFVDYYVSDEGIASVSEVGYVSLDDSALSTLRDTWGSRTTGTTES